MICPPGGMDGQSSGHQAADRARKPELVGVSCEAGVGYSWSIVKRNWTLVTPICLDHGHM